jgi:hypothetical protein
VGDAYGEDEVYYCSEDISRVYRDGKFEKSGVTGKFRIKLDRPLETELVQWKKKLKELKEKDTDGWNIKLLINLQLAYNKFTQEKYTCEFAKSFKNDPEFISCHNTGLLNGRLFSMSLDGKRFELFTGGYASNQNVAVLSFGNCTNFD